MSVSGGTGLLGHVLYAMLAAGPAEAAAGPAGAEASGPAEGEPERRHDTLMFSNYLGLAVGVRWGRREIGPLGVPEDREAREAAASGLGGLQGRLAGFSATKAKIGRGRRLLTPELSVALVLGGTRWTAEGAAARRGGVAVGAQGILRIGIGRATGGLVSPYGKLQLEQRFAAYLRDTAEGNHAIASLRGSAGILGRTHHDSFVLLAGAAVDGVAGAQAIGRRAAVLQLMAGAELAIYAHPRRHLYLGWVGDARATVAGEGRGGRRIDGRATFDLMIGRPLSRRITYVSLLASYDVTEVRASPATSPIASTGERRIGHAALLGVGVGFL